MISIFMRITRMVTVLPKLKGYLDVSVELQVPLVHAKKTWAKNFKETSSTFCRERISGHNEECVLHWW